MFSFVAPAVLPLRVYLQVGVRRLPTQAPQCVDAGGHEAGGLLSTIGRSMRLSAAEGEHHVRPFIDPVIHQWNWWQSGGTKFTIGTHVDGLSVMLVVVVALG